MLQMLTYVPKPKTKNPNMMIIMSLIRIQLYLPRSESQNVIISNTGGNIMAKVELLPAPTNDITALKSGIIIARPTETDRQTIIRLQHHHHLSSYFFIFSILTSK